MRNIYILLFVSFSFLSASEYQDYSNWNKIKDTNALYQTESGESRIDTDYNYIYSEDNAGHSLSFQAFVPWHTRVFSFTYNNILREDETQFHESTLSLAHQLSSTLNVFTGITGEFSSSDNNEWGVSGQIGFTKKAGNGFFLSNREIGFAMEGLGTSVHGEDSWFNGINPLFNPLITFNGSLISNEKMTLSWMNTFSLPFYKAVSWNTQLNFDTSDGWGISLVSTFDSKLLSEGDFLSLVPGLQIRYAPGSSDRNWAVRTTVSPVENDILLSPGVSWRPFSPDRSSPEINLDWQGVRYLSPDNDGLNDTLHIPLEVSDRNYIQKVRFSVYSEREKLVFNHIFSRDDELTGAGDYIGRFFSNDEDLVIPSHFNWTGLTGDDKKLSDGWYYVEISVEDIYGNITLSEHKPLNIDTLAPELIMKDRKSLGSRNS